MSRHLRLVAPGEVAADPAQVTAAARQRLAAFLARELEILPSNHATAVSYRRQLARLQARPLAGGS